MQQKILALSEFYKYFSLQDPGAGAGIEKERPSNENFFWVQSVFPKSFFPIQKNSWEYDHPFVQFELEEMQRIQVKFELFAVGRLDSNEVFIFKPWVVNISDPMIYGLFENFHLYIPATLFYNLISRLIFLGNLNPNMFQTVRVLQDIPLNAFHKFGVIRKDISTQFKTKRLTITKVENINKDDVLQFYKLNGESINKKLENVYFTPSMNTWFKITLPIQGSSWFGLKKTNQEKTVGYIRLYNTKSSFSGGFLIEYIIEKENRNEGFGNEASKGIIEYLKKNSYITCLGAEVNDDNKFSIQILRNCGFINKKNNSPFMKENYSLSLNEHIEENERFIKNNALETLINEYYVKKHARYFE